MQRVTHEIAPTQKSEDNHTKFRDETQNTVLGDAKSKQAQNTQLSEEPFFH